VAIARAIVTTPKILLLDEPLSNLDAKLRIDMRSEIKRLHQEMGTTVIYVTHDQIEALTMSTKVAIFFEGVLMQVDNPLEVYRNPASLKVADFIGNPRINFVEGKAVLKGDDLVVNSDLGEYVFDKKYFASREFPQSGAFECVLGLRPEQLFPQQKASPGALEAQVYASQPAGSETLVQVQVKETRLLVKELGIGNYDRDQKLYFDINPDMINVFNEPPRSRAPRYL
jgi:multiple sugar transport system ATP-binding protein